MMAAKPISLDHLPGDKTPAERVRAARLHAGWSQQYLATKLSRPGRAVTKNRVSDLELGRVNLTHEMAGRLRTAFRSVDLPGEIRPF